MPEGPDFVDLKSNIKGISYANGSYEDFHPVKPEPEKPVSAIPVQKYKLEPDGKKFRYGDLYLKEMKMYRFVLQKNDPELSKAVKKAKSSKWKKYIGFGAIPFGAATILYYGVYKFYSDPSNSLYNPDLASAALYDTFTNAAVTVACGAIGITCNIQHKKHNKKVVDIYNALP